MSRYEQQFLRRQTGTSKSKHQDTYGSSSDLDKSGIEAMESLSPESGYREERDQYNMWHHNSVAPKSVSPVSAASDEMASFEAQGLETLSLRANRDILAAGHRPEDDDEYLASDDEALIQVLEQERRERHKERIKLFHCIHAQQLELSQRTVAVQDRATDIAKDFAQIIASFEERLVVIEENVQKELMAVKLIAGSLHSAVTVLTAALPTLKERLAISETEKSTSR